MIRKADLKLEAVQLVLAQQLAVLSVWAAEEKPGPLVYS